MHGVAEVECSVAKVEYAVAEVRCGVPDGCPAAPGRYPGGLNLWAAP